MTDRAPQDPTPAPKPVRTLVVDDDEAARHLIRAVVEGETDVPMEVVAEARDGVEAVELAAEVGPDLVVLDLNMPRMGGLEALPRIRERCPGARVVVFSTRADDEMRKRTLGAGAIAHVQKGADLDELLDALREAST